MKKTSVTVPWKQGLHMRPAARLVRFAIDCGSSIKLYTNGKVADARSILGVMLLCAVMGTVLDVEVAGGDEAHAIATVESIFETDEVDEEDVGADSESRLEEDSEDRR